MEIKFRLRVDKKIVGYCRWFEGSKYYKPGWEYTYFQSMAYTHELDGGLIAHNKKDISTALKDKHGKEAYFDDLIKFSCGVFVIGWDKQRGRVILHQINKRKKPVFMTGGMIQDGERIGSIHETPEFLK